MILRTQYVRNTSGTGYAICGVKAFVFASNSPILVLDIEIRSVIGFCTTCHF